MQRLEMDILRPDSFKISESFKVIRSNIMFLGNEKKAIMITSTIMGEGKSTVSWNLAVSIADSGKKVLFIDADMRKSVFIGRNHVRTRTQGLSHFLAGQAQLDEVIFSTPLDNLFVMPSGKFPPNPSELLTQSVFGNMIKALRDDFDYIIIDTPPIASAIDAAVISNVCDGSVIVIGSRKVTSRIIKDSIEQLNKSGKQVLGAILNKVNYDDFPITYSRKYGKYYGYYDSENSDEGDAK